MRMRGLTIFDAATLVLLASVALLVELPRWRVRGMLRREDEVVNDLTDFAKRLEVRRKSGARDTDGDGRAEHGPLGDILGSRREQAVEVQPGIFDIAGYKFAVLVPGQRKTPVLAGSTAAVPDYAEVGWMIVAWPSEGGVTGMRAYAITTYGVLVHQIDGYPYGDSPPIPDAQMVFLDGDKIIRADHFTGKDWGVPIQTSDRPAERAANRSAATTQKRPAPVKDETPR